MSQHNTPRKMRLVAPLVLSMIVAAINVGPAIAQTGTTASFTTQIYISNPNATAATAVVNFYAESSGTADAFNVPVSLNPYGSATVLVGGLTTGFKGSAVISSDQNVVAAAAQVPQEGLVNRPMYTAFNSGTPNLYLSTFLANRNSQFSLFAVQNVESSSVNVRAKFIENGTTVEDLTVVVPSNASKFFDSTQPTTTISSNFANYMYTHAGGFSGSVVVTATKVSDGSAANIVGLSEELKSNSGSAISFEAIPQTAGATTIYIPSALCNATSQVQTTFFAVQNMGGINASVAITYISAATGNVAGTETTALVSSGGKVSLNPCLLATGSTGTVPGTGFNGSAIVRSTQPLNAVAKKISTNAPYGNFATAFLGQGTGSNKVAVPYVRWGVATGQTGSIVSTIAVQNIGSSAIAAGGIQIKFYSSSGGSPVMTCSSVAATNPNAKVNAAWGIAFATTSCSPSTSNTAFNGNVIVEGPTGSSLAVIETNQMNQYTYQTEDYNGVIVP